MRKKQVVKKKKVSMLLPSIMIMLTFALLYMSIPKLYGFVKEKEYPNKTKELIAQLIDTTDVTEIINSFAIDNQCSIHITNTTTNEVFRTSTVSFLEYKEYTETYVDTNNQAFTLELRYSTENMIYLEKILALVLPVFALLSIILLYIYFKVKLTNVDDIIEDLAIATDKMIDLNPNARYKVDELHTTNKKVADNINEIYNELLYSISILETKIQENTEFEQATLDILKKTTEAIVAPIEEIKTMVNGMLKNQGVYRNHQIYLLETRIKLDELANLIKQELSNPLISSASKLTIVPVDIKVFMDELLQPYRTMSLVKKVNVSNTITSSFDVQFNPLIFPKAISHLLNYAFNHAEEGSDLVIRNEHYNVIIEYCGHTISSRDILSELIISDDLSLATKLFYQLKLPFDFEEGQKPNTMKFIIHF